MPSTQTTHMRLSFSALCRRRKCPHPLTPPHSLLFLIVINVFVPASESCWRGALRLLRSEMGQRGTCAVSAIGRSENSREAELANVRSPRNLTLAPHALTSRSTTAQCSHSHSSSDIHRQQVIFSTIGLALQE